MAKQWTEEELSILKSNYHLVKGIDMEKLLPLRKKHSIHKKAEQLGLRGYVISEWSQEDIVSLIQNYKTHTVDEMVVAGLCSGRSKTAIKKKIRTLGLEKRTRWTDEEEQVLSKMYRDLKNKDIQELIPTKSVESIAGHASKVMGLKKDPHVWQRTYSYNRRFFSAINNSSCYFAGFIAADGSVDADRGTMRIHLNAKDTGLLISFAEYLEFTGNVRIKKVSKVTGDMMGASLYLSSAQDMLQDLEDNFNIVQNKTHILKPPTHLTGENALAFIIGYIDGDGSIYLPSKPDAWGHFYMHASMAGTKEMLEWVKSIFDKLCPSMYGKNAKVFDIKDKRSYSYHVAGNRAYNILKILEATKTPYRLSRKWNKIKEYEELIRDK